MTDAETIASLKDQVEHLSAALSRATGRIHQLEDPVRLAVKQDEAIRLAREYDAPPVSKWWKQFKERL